MTLTFETKCIRDSRCREIILYDAPRHALGQQHRLLYYILTHHFIIEDDTSVLVHDARAEQQVDGRSQCDCTAISVDCGQMSRAVILFDIESGMVIAEVVCSVLTTQTNA